MAKTRALARFALAADSAPAVAEHRVDSIPAAAVQVVARGEVCIPAAGGLLPAFAVGGMTRPVVGHNDYTYVTCRS